jgi:hypothetical protein
VLDGQQKFLIALKNPNAPSREPLVQAIQNQSRATVVVDEIPFDEALAIAHKIRKEKPKLEGVQFMDDLEHPDFFYILSTREAGRDVD